MRKIPILHRFVDTILKWRAQEIVNRMNPHLKGSVSILDIGCGSCHIAKELTKNGYEVVPIDISNGSYNDINPIIYDGCQIPYKDQSIDTAVLITVLHHTKNPEQIVQEAGRVAKKIIIIEDVVLNTAHKFIVSIWDSLLNFEFFGHPHTNKTDAEWHKVFLDKNLKIIDTNKKWSFIFMWQVTYHLEAINNDV